MPTIWRVAAARAIASGGYVLPVQTNAPDVRRPSWIGLLLRHQAVLFVVVGGLNTLIGFGLFAAFHRLLGEHLSYQLTLVPTYALGTLIAFWTQRRFVFRVRGHVLPDLARFASVQMGSLVVNAVLLTVLTELLGLPVLVGQAISLAVIVVGTYFAHLLFSFKRH
jgi:putative flippase GtrA